MNRRPSQGFLKKLSTFSLVVLAGTIHRVKIIGASVFNLETLKKTSQGPFVPNNLKQLLNELDPSKTPLTDIEQKELNNEQKKFMEIQKKVFEKIKYDQQVKNKEVHYKMKKIQEIIKKSEESNK